MTIKEIVLEALSALELDELKKAVEEDSADADASADYERFLGYAVSVVVEIATDYRPLKRVKKLRFAGGILPYGDIDPEFHALYDVSGKRDRGRCLAQGLELEAGDYEIEYGVMPKTGENDPLPFTGVANRTVILGIMTEYYLAAGMFEQAVTFDKRYRDSLYHAARPRGETKLRERRWL